MERLTPSEKSEGREKKRPKRERGFFGNIGATIKASLESRKGSKEAPFFDIASLLISFLFARCHIIFGSHPLAIAFIAVLPSRVWISLLGAAIGALTLGKHGIIYAMISVIVVFLRIIVSGTDKREEGSTGDVRLFSENLLLRMSAAVIGGFIAAVYEILLSGFSLTTVMFGLSMVLLPPLLTFAFSGLFDVGVGFGEIFDSDAPVFSLARKSEKEKYNLIFFQCAALLFLFVVSLSLKEYELFGINAAYIFSAAITLFIAKRFGALRAAAVGFSSALGLSGTHAAAFALAGLASGALFRLGIVYALVGGAITLSAWSAYVGGLSGFLATFPEYVISAAVMTPLLRRLSPEKTEDEQQSAEKAATEMVGTMALSFKSNRESTLNALEIALSSISSVIKRHSEKTARPTEEELADLIVECSDRYCRTCEGYRTCIAGERGEKSFLSCAEKAAKILYKNGRLSPGDLSDFPEMCRMSEGVAESINRAAAILAEEKYRAAAKESISEEFDLISKLISEARRSDERECSMDEELSEKIGQIVTRFGMSDGVARAFGDRVKHVIIAAEDERGTKITSTDLLRAIESAGNIKLGTPEFFRRGKMALMECSSQRMYSAECATASVAGTRDEISGDTARAFETADGYFFSLISDGMGSGEEAKETSQFVSDLLLGALDFGTGKETVMKILNHIILSRRGECSATVDLFGIDLYKGEATFIKSGAAPSYIKRAAPKGDGGDSIFRIRSRTAPIGLMKELDAEKIRVEVQSEDLIVMLSDGISQNAEDSPWLLELLSAPAKRNLKEYADLILSTAMKNVTPTDDMTVCVTRIRRI